MSFFSTVARIVCALILTASIASRASGSESNHPDVLRPGNLIGPKDAQAAAGWLSPGTLKLVEQGMQIRVVVPQRIEWPPPYKIATEKYSGQARLGDGGDLQGYSAGLPFPLLDVNDAHAAQKVMWNYFYGPLWTDDLDLHPMEVGNFTGSPVYDSVPPQFLIGHVAAYNNLGRTEVAPLPRDLAGLRTGVRRYLAAYPFLEPPENRGLGFIRYDYLDPQSQDDFWLYNPYTRRNRRIASSMLSDPAQSWAQAFGNLDPDSYLGFSAKIENFDYRLLSARPMLASLHAQAVPARRCESDGGRSVCPENWELRNVYVIEARARRTGRWREMPLVPRRVLYIDAEAWVMTASDQYDRDGQLWKTLAAFYTFRDRSTPSAKVAIYRFNRLFETAMVDEDVQNGFCSVVRTPPGRQPLSECWYINMGSIDRSFFRIDAMANAGH